RAWVPVAVPGDVHGALVAAGRLAHPFHDRNEDACRWMEEREWWYRLRFDGPAAAAPGERLRLVFHGLDTYATVYLDGTSLGSHRNMFRPASFDVTDAVRPGGENVLAVRFDPPLQHVGPDLPGQWAPFNHERVWMRKAQYGYGWDWGPRLPTIGVWRPVELRRERHAIVAGVRFATLRLPRPGAAALAEVEVDAERFAGSRPLDAVVTLRPPGGGDPVEATIALDGHARGTADLSLPDPPLWWTHDLGKPALHDLRVVLRSGGEEVDAWAQRVGVRTIELDQRPDPEEPGTRFFRFMLNGVPLFARGANWIPADSFPGDVPAARYERLIEDARAANMTMLRVWGGGLYEHDRFYALCDERGLLVWQDFMFACAAYPEPDLAEEVEREARYQVARLRNHPSLALWCGNNENQWIHDQHHPHERANRVPGQRYYDDVLPRVVAELDPATPYWPGSPYGGDDHNGREDGDVHDWEVWHGNHPRRFGEDSRRAPTPESVSFLRYAEDTGRFISEFGVLSAPDRRTLRRWIPADELYHHSPALDHHTKDTPKDKIDMLLQSVTGVAGDLDAFVDFSMIAQAEALKFGIEHFRRRAPHCSGTLIWQLNDCWPGLSWSLLDFHGIGKAAYFFVRRAYAPVLASFRLPGDGSAELWVTNDTAAPVRDTARVRLGRFAGPPLHEEEVRVDVAPHTSRRMGRWSAAQDTPERYLSVRSAAGAFPANRAFFAAIKDLARERPALTHAVEAVSDDTLAVRLRAPAYAYFVHVSVPQDDAGYSDNYVELEPGEERTITIAGRRGSLPPEDVEVRWR
ncbi:MAG TPA: glycoside hydrolase family 2 protein, partial [Solirubrobacteraceae bacterium]|nr:glycoside hydrolase family 2 protein [Solirubrobacteraceae bacterium]